VVALAQADEALHPPQERVGVLVLGLDVDAWSGTRIDDHGQEEALGLAREKPALRSLSTASRAHRVAVAEIDVVAIPISSP